MRKTTFLSVCLAAAGALFFGASMDVHAAEGTIADGVSIEGMNVAGMTADQANDVVADYLLSYENAVFTLNAEGKSIEAKGNELGIHSLTDVTQQALNYGKKGNPLATYMEAADLESGKTKDFGIAVTADARTMKNYLADHEEELVTLVVNNSLTRQDGQFIYTPGTPGKKIKVNESVATTMDYILTQWDGNDVSLDMEVISKEPEGDEEQLKSVQDVLGSFNTNFGSTSTPRGTNVANGTSKIDGLLLYPGENASVEHLLGAMTAENGYAPAASYENGKTVQTYGGGICQVSTTLYNALIRAELQIDERHCHSMVVGYVDLSADAAISEGAKDLKFTNNTDYPIYIEGYVANGNVYFNVWGKETRDPSRQVSFVSETLSVTYPGNVFEPHPEYPAGATALIEKAHTGYKAQLWKIVNENGVEVSREVFNKSSYRATNNIYAVGTGSDNPDITNALNAAIGTQSGQAVADAVAGVGGDASAVPTVSPAEQVAIDQANAAAAAEAAAAAAAAEQPAPAE